MIINRATYGLGLFFFFLMLIIPTMYQLERGGILTFLLITASAYVYATNNWKMNRDIGFIGILCITSSLLFMLIGTVRDAPGSLQVGTVFVLWPLIFLFFVGFLSKPEQLFPFMKVLLIGAIVSSFLGIFFVLEGLGFVDLGVSNLFVGVVANFGITKDGLIGYSLPNTTTVIYALPFLLAWLMLPRFYVNINKLWRFLLWLGILLCVTVLILAGRKVFWLIAFVSPFIIISLFKLCYIPINMKKMANVFTVILLAMITIFMFSEISIGMIWNDFITGFDFHDSNNLAAHVRNEQLYSLFRGWMDFPLFGAGHGSVASVIRNDHVPWAYELSYVALLFQTGLLGVAIYGGAVVWLFIQSIKVVRRMPESAEMLLPLLSGTACFLIANFTNPYLEKFDYLWTLFLPLAVLNAYLLKKRVPTMGQLRL